MKKSRTVILFFFFCILISACSGHPTDIQPVFRTDDIVQIVFCKKTPTEQEYPVPEAYLGEIIEWLGSFVPGKQAKDPLPPGADSLYVKIRYGDGSFEEASLSTITINQTLYILYYDKEPACFFDLFSYVSLPYDLFQTASVELHAYDGDSEEPFAKVVANGEEAASIAEMFSSLNLKELSYSESSINSYDFWFKDADGNLIAQLALSCDPSPLVVVGTTAYQDVNGGVDLDFLAQLVDMTVSSGPMHQEDGAEHSASAAPLFYKSAPGLSVQHDGQTVQALPGTSSWQYMNPDGTATGIEADSMHPLDAKDYMPVLPAVEGEVCLVFDTAPDEVTVKAWPVSAWGNQDAVDEAIAVPVSEGKITLLEGGHIYEVFAKWTRFKEFGGAAYYSFCTSPLGVTLTAEAVTPNGLTLVCTQSGGAPTGELQTGSPFWLEVCSEGNWFPVKEDMADAAWTMEALSIPRNKRVEWNVSWETLYGSLSAGHYRIGKEIMDFRMSGSYDKYHFYAEFTVD